MVYCQKRQRLSAIVFYNTRNRVIVLLPLLHRFGAAGCATVNLLSVYLFFGAKAILLRKRRQSSGVAKHWATLPKPSLWPGISFFMRHVAKLPNAVPTVIYPRPSVMLPSVMSTEEIKKLIDRVQNIKRRTILMLLYITGMRVSEIASRPMMNKGYCR